MVNTNDPRVTAVASEFFRMSELTWNCCYKMAKRAVEIIQEMGMVDPEPGHPKNAMMLKAEGGPLDNERWWGDTFHSDD